jgi:hypothetical protein
LRERWSANGNAECVSERSGDGAFVSSGLAKITGLLFADAASIVASMQSEFATLALAAFCPPFSQATGRAMRSLRYAAGTLACFTLSILGASTPEQVTEPSSKPWIAMDYGPYFTATLEVENANIANKGVAIRLDHGPGGVSRGNEFLLFDTDTLRCAAGWTGKEFIDWRNVALDSQHEVHPAIRGQLLFSNRDAPGWENPAGRFEDQRIVGRDGNRYGPLPREWARWKGLYVHGDKVVLSYTVGESDVLELPDSEGSIGFRLITRTINLGPRERELVLQVAHQTQGRPQLDVIVSPNSSVREFALLTEAARSSESTNVTWSTLTAVAVIGSVPNAQWITTDAGDLQLRIPASQRPLRFKILYAPVTAAEDMEQFRKAVAASTLPVDLAQLTKGGPIHWKEIVTTRRELLGNSDGPYIVESISVPTGNPYRSWMRLGGFDFFKNGSQAAVCTWQGDVWLVDGLGGEFDRFTWRRIASGMFQPLGLKIVDETIYVTCRDQITILRDLNGDGETDFYQSFNNDAQVTEHFHEFAMDLQTDKDGNFYYTKAGRHAKDALVPQHGTLLKVSQDGSKTQIIASGFRAPNGVCVNGDGTFIISDQEGHWTPENRINWVKPGGFYGYMMGYHEGRQPGDFEPPVLWIHKTFDRSPAEQLWVTSDKWGPLQGALLSLSYGTGRIFEVMHDRVGDVVQGGIVALPVPEMPTGIMRGRFHPVDGQLYVAGLFGWAGNKTKPGGFYRIRYTGKPLHVPVALRATRRGISIQFSDGLDPSSAADPNFSVSRWTYRRTAKYGSQDYKISQKDLIGRDRVEVTEVKLSEDGKSLLLEIPDMQPSMQMEIKYTATFSDGTKVSQVIENTIHTLPE